ncbi:MAG: DUF4115 domain-containing protein [Alphaproteobacteria bacterium]|nr:DUF4115 domain-containing protein [Alphaproteobacteria bacterium]
MVQIGQGKAAGEEEIFHTDMSVGEILRRTRVHYGQSLDDIEKALRIRAIQIEAIEDNRIDKLPGRVYAIGFVRSYSEYLGLDGEKMVRLLKRQSGVRTRDPKLHFPVVAMDSKIPSGWIVAASAAVVVLILFGFWISGAHDRAAISEIPPVPPAMKPAVPSAAPKEKAPERADSENPVAAPAEAPKGIILNVRQNSWVEIRDKRGAAVVSRVLQAGDQYFVPDRPDLTISLGNAGGIDLQLDGESLRALGRPGEVRRNIPLDIEFLKEHYSAGKTKAVAE